MAKNIFTGFYTDMIVNFTPNTSQQNTFTSRDKVIRRADDIARLVNRKYTRISCSNIGDFTNIGKRPEVYNRLASYINKMRNVISMKTIKAGDGLSKIKVFTDTLSEYKVGNCDEAAKMAYIAAETNNIHGAQLATLETFIDGEPDKVRLISQDHVVLRVDNGKKPYVIDPWLGFADYIPQAIQRYKNEFGYHFHFSTNPDDKVLIYPRAAQFDLMAHSVAQEDWGKTFPELILPEPQKHGFKSKVKRLCKNIKMFFKNILQK